MSRLAPLSEEPINEDEEYSTNCSRKKGYSWKNWLKTHFYLVFSKKSDLKVLLSVLGCPLFPVSIHSKLPITEVCSSAQYIIQHFSAATGCRKLQGEVKNIFATGKVTMAMVDELGGSAMTGAATVARKGCFVMWQMAPNKWLIELVVDGHKVVAGSDGNVAWRHTPWLASHAAKGGVRPLRRALQASGTD
ncbi:LIPASE [Salix viminalis]|uniref:LIPASE n=1 Tax=Salix viminalis TaxID=40686 RepID=A0A9Q0ZQE4_SALVM|nr:LIPASE [Salix viminalis]